VTAPRRITRRSLLRRVRYGLLTAAAGVAGYAFWQTWHLQVRRQSIVLPNLPPAFAGKTIAVLADFHHGPFVGLPYIRAAAELAQSLNPDAIALVGDFGHKGYELREKLPPCLDALSSLHAPLGVFAVPGNHDMLEFGHVYERSIRNTPLTDLTNRAVRVTIGADSMWFAGVDDLWFGNPDLRTAIADVPNGSAVVLLSHNPDFAEVDPDPRVGLILSGHTHGGQVYLPIVGAPWVPSRYGAKYLAGLVRGPASQVYVSRGIGEAAIPVRFNCPPEINLLTLTAG
jgi:predicted MPP superfamily phosphohydrolase